MATPDNTEFILDGVQSVINSAMGGKNALNPRLQPVNITNLSAEQQSDLYEGAWMIGKTVDILAEDMTREGWYVKHPTASLDAINSLDQRLNHPYIKERFQQLIKDGFIFGGSAIIADLQDGQDQRMPVNPKTLKKIGKLRSLDPSWVQPAPETIAYDLFEPEYYVVSPTGYTGEDFSNQFIWHNSRIIRFEGLHLPHSKRIRRQGWGGSLIDRLYDPWQKLNELETHILIAVERMSVFVHAIKNLHEFARRGQLKQLEKYLHQVHTQLLHSNTLVMDAEAENGQFVSRSVSGLDSLYSEFKESFTAASTIAWSIFWERAGTGGLSNGGNSELKQWASHIRALQENKIKLGLHKLATWIIFSEDFEYTKEFTDGGLEIEFNPLYPLSELEEKEKDSKRATMIATLLREGVSMQQIHEIEEGAPLDVIGDVERPEMTMMNQQAENAEQAGKSEQAEKAQKEGEGKEQEAEMQDEAPVSTFDLEAIVDFDQLNAAINAGAEILPETYSRILAASEES